MSNIFEALVQAEQIQSLQITPAAAQADPGARVEASSMTAEMTQLYLKVQSLLPKSPQKVIQFIGSRSGEGVSTLAREYACVAGTFGHTVLILDTNRHNDGQRRFFRMTNRYGWEDAVRDPSVVNSVVSRLGDSAVYLAGPSLRKDDRGQLVTPNQIDQLLVAFKRVFDLIIVDSPPAAAGPEAVLFTRGTDGVLLVVEAEKTRSPVVESTKGKIIDSGGKILGMVFNKRRNYVPEWIYSRL